PPARRRPGRGVVGGGGARPVPPPPPRRALYNDPATDRRCAWSCPSPERSPSSRRLAPTSGRSAPARPAFAACCAPPPSLPAAPDLQEITGCSHQLPSLTTRTITSRRESFR